MALTELEDEGARGLADKVLKALRSMPSLSSPMASTAPTRERISYEYFESPGLTIPFAGLFSPTIPPISASYESYVRMVGLVIRGLAHEGSVLILGRGGQAVLRRQPRALHVQVVAPLESRCKLVMEREGLEWRAAQNKVRASDRARFDYVRRYHGVNWLDSTLYHLVINTGWIEVDAAVDLIVRAQHAIADRSDREACP
jgi:hypothetical protein